MKMDVKLTRLDYASPQPKWWLRHRRATVGMSILIALAATGWLFRRQLAVISDNIRLRWLEQRCLSYTADTSQVVYEEDPVRAEALLKLPGYHKIIRSVDPAAPIAGFIPPEWEAFARTADRWRFGLDLPRANLFLHEMQTKGGRRRLIAEDVLPDGYHGKEAIRFHTYIFTLGGPFESPESVRHMGGDIPTLCDAGKASKNLRIFAARLDPKDASKFRYEFEINGQRGWVEETLIDVAGEDDATRIDVVYSTSPSR